MNFRFVSKLKILLICTFTGSTFSSGIINAENGYEFWLRYRKIADEKLLSQYSRFGREIVQFEDDAVLNSAAAELVLGLSQMLGNSPSVSSAMEKNSGSIIIGSIKNAAIKKLLPSDVINKLKSTDGFCILTLSSGKNANIVIAGQSGRGVLYGVFQFLRLLQTYQPVTDLRIIEIPVNKLRMVNHWDNPSGSIERGYAGNSIFHWDTLPELEQRYTDYARMLASVGINGCVINNVNTFKQKLTGWKLLTSPYLTKVKALAQVFRSYGVKLYLSVNFFSPIIVGNLKTADPLNEEVIHWWENKVDEIYREIPDFGGFLIKADSEGEPGPMKYNRSHAEGANMLADILAGHDGLLIWRAFVYGHNNRDRASQAYSIFQPDDGKFAENVIIQIKNGPIDFQVREPVSPLFGAMPSTNQMLEFQITQEYTGHSTHLCYLVPQWKDVLDFDTELKGNGPTVAEIVSGRLFNNKHSGIAGVSNIGSDINWTGHHLAQANTYGFGRLAWNPELSAAQITNEWTRLTFGNDKEVVDVISKILLGSWQTYESYTSPLGVGLMSNKDGAQSHFLPAPEIRYEIHRADKSGVGYDRTAETGSGFVNQYSPPVAAYYNDINTCPDELLLFFHHVPYSFKLKNGKTVIQHIYDIHYEGVLRVENMIEEWKSIKGKIDPERYDQILAKFNEQLSQAIVWRDAINNYFYSLSGIPDESGRLVKLN